MYSESLWFPPSENVLSTQHVERGAHTSNAKFSEQKDDILGVVSRRGPGELMLALPGRGSVAKTTLD